MHGLVSISPYCIRRVDSYNRIETKVVPLTRTNGSLYNILVIQQVSLSSSRSVTENVARLNMIKIFHTSYDFRGLLLLTLGFPTHQTDKFNKRFTIWHF